MKIAMALVLAILSGCVYAPVMQSSYNFDRHPGVSMEVWMQYDAYGSGYMVTTLINRSNVPKCAWTSGLDSRPLRPGESWQVGQVQTPGGVGVANVVPWDPNCINAKRDAQSPAR